MVNSKKLPIDIGPIELQKVILAMQDVKYNSN